MRLVILSNRLPFTVSFKEGRREFRASSGGLTTGLWSYLRQAGTAATERLDFLWLGWPGASVGPEDEEAVTTYAQREFQAAPVLIPGDKMDRFYHGFCNRTLWPLFHYFPSLTHYDEQDWQEYQQVNRLYAEAVLKVLQPDDLLWVHDYHLMLVPAMVRERLPELPIGFFLHIPFPSYEVFRLLPRAWRSGLIQGLLGASVVGFHTHDYTRDFLTSVLRTEGYEHQLGTLTIKDRVVKADTFPMGIDYQHFREAASSEITARKAAELRAKCAGRKIIFSVDRLDYTKGLINRLRGYDTFLKRNPQWRGKVVLIVSVAPSRIGVESYRAMRLELEQTVGRIVGAYGDVHWTPLIYQFRALDFDDIVAMYRASDVALVTPLRDGMNLVAKEFVASRPDGTGVLILSEMAGAAKEMGEALIINPVHSGEFAQALEQALTMPKEEQVRRNRLLQVRLQRYNVVRWAEEFLQTLVSAQKTEAARRVRVLRGKAQSEMMEACRTAAQRAFLLDYDGTLVPFVEDPKRAQPDEELLELLARASAAPDTEVVMVSGRPRRDLEEWFGHLPVSLVAEHGVWLRARGEEWRMLRAVGTDWKDRVRPILQRYVDRLPGALLEEKEFSLAWHYRAADAEQASRRSRELLDALAGFTRNVDVQVLEGNKVLEIRTTGVSKGTAALEWLRTSASEFVLAIGDDWTDEDLFRALPETAYSIRVGMAATAARYYLGSHVAVRRLLRDLVDQIPAKGSAPGNSGRKTPVKRAAPAEVPQDSRCTA